MEDPQLLLFWIFVFLPMSRHAGDLVKCSTKSACQDHLRQRVTSYNEAFKWRHLFFGLRYEYPRDLRDSCGPAMRTARHAKNRVSAFQTNLWWVWVSDLFLAADRMKGSAGVPPTNPVSTSGFFVVFSHLIHLEYGFRQILMFASVLTP